MKTALPVNFRSEVLENGQVIVYDVPIFAVCEKDGIQFGEDWIDRAVQYHRAGEDNRGSWAMHIHHTGEPRDILPAGTFRNVRKGMIRTKFGKRVPGVIADLLFTDEAAARRAKLGQLLWRSPEIPLLSALGKKHPRFKTLALLDREAPHNDDLPVLTFKAPGTVQNAKTPAEPSPWVRIEAEAVLAFSESETSIWALMEPNAMSEPNATQENLKFEDGESPASEGGSESKSESKGEGGGWKSKLDALKAVKIPAEDIPDFVGALRELADSMGGESAEEMPDNPVENEPADVGDMPMKESSDVVRLRDEVIALKAEVLAQKKATEQSALTASYEKAVDAAVERLKGKGVTRDEIVKFAESEPLARRAATVAKFADVMDAKLLDRTADFEDYINQAAGATQEVPDAVLKFQAEGSDAYEHALTQYRTWKAQPQDRRDRIPLEMWLDIYPPGGNPQFMTTQTGN